VSAWELRGAVTAATATVAAATGQGAHISYDNDNANDSSESPGSAAQERGRTDWRVGRALAVPRFGSLTN